MICHNFLLIATIMYFTNALFTLRFFVLVCGNLLQGLKQLNFAELPCCQLEN